MVEPVTRSDIPSPALPSTSSRPSVPAVPMVTGMPLSNVVRPVHATLDTG